MEDLFKIEKMDNITKFINHSDYKIFLSLRPVKPKRKYYDFLLIHPNSFMIIEYELDFTQISIHFEKGEIK